MQVILLHDVDALGEGGAIVQVANGYARNYLFPRKLAIVASAGALKDLESRKVQIQMKAEKRHQENLKKAEQLEAIGLLALEAHAGEGGKLFGTITPKDLVAVLEHKVGFIIDRKNLILNNPINRVGKYELVIRLSARVKATVAIEVTAQGAQNAYQQQAEELDYNVYDDQPEVQYDLPSEDLI